MSCFRKVHGILEGLALIGSSLSGAQPAHARQGAAGYTSVEVLRTATATNGELLGPSGFRNPCPGRPGVVEEGALADLQLIDGDPLADIALVADPARNFRIIMKDGKIYKNTL